MCLQANCSNVLDQSLIHLASRQNPLYPLESRTTSPCNKYDADIQNLKFIGKKGYLVEYHEYITDISITIFTIGTVTIALV